MENLLSRMSLALIANSSEFPRLQAFIESTCRQAGCSAGQHLRMQLVMEELFTNTIKYGRNGAAPVSITVAMEFGGRRPITVRYEDDSLQHDPFEQSGTEDELGFSVTRRRIGGLGIVLVRELGNEVQYAWSEGRNRVTFMVPLDSPARRQY
jgi:anti-sigma regulatory factor (Ser/Thr protein kinase)